MDVPSFADSLAATMPGAPQDPHDARNRRNVFAVIGGGLVVTMLAQPSWIGSLPIKYLLKDVHHLDPSQMANFLALAAFAWYLKPVAGIASDSLPLLGGRRKTYLLLSCASAALLWGLMSLATGRFRLLLGITVTLNLAIVVASTVVGGVLVEEGQRWGATGRLSSMRSILKTISAMIAGPATGYLATRPFPLTSAVGATLFVAVLPIVARWYREPPATAPAKATSAVWHELKTVAVSWPLWTAAIMLFLVELAPGFQTPLFFHQTDVLKFDAPFLGSLSLIGGISGLAAGLAYAYACKRLPLRTLLVIALTANALTSLGFLGYKSRTSAVVVESLAGFGMVLGNLPLFDLAARAAPRKSAALAYALLMSAWNAAVACSDVLGSWLYTRWHLSFGSLVWLNAGSTLLTLALVPFLPRRLVATTDAGEAVAT